jgi:hypothetical protein
MKKRILDKQNSRYLSPLDTLSCFKETFNWNCFMALRKSRFFDFFDKTKNCTNIWCPYMFSRLYWYRGVTVLLPGWVIRKYWNCPWKFFSLGSWLVTALSTPNGGEG